MEQYLTLLKAIKEKGTVKPAARKGMPSTTSLFGYQFRHNLQDGFPILTTKEVYWKGIVVELLWFLRGDTNVEFLIDNGINIWNEDAYNYYKKNCLETKQNCLTFEDFIEVIKRESDLKGMSNKHFSNGYVFGDCGFQYGKVWRKWETQEEESIKTGDTYPSGEYKYEVVFKTIDQIKNLVHSLKSTPESRRHIVTAIDPAHDTQLALYWCHAMFQFNCRPIEQEKRLRGWLSTGLSTSITKEIESTTLDSIELTNLMDNYKVPKYYLDCQLYQRSADVILGVPFNISSYALLTHILAKVCNMIPGEFVHTFGDVHIYENHEEAVEEQLKRVPTTLPKLVMNNHIDWNTLFERYDFTSLVYSDFLLENYSPQSKIKAKLSTGLK